MLSQIKNRVRRKPVKQSINTGGNRIIVNLERQQGSRYQNLLKYLLRQSRKWSPSSFGTAMSLMMNSSSK